MITAERAEGAEVSKPKILYTKIAKAAKTQVLAFAIFAVFV